MANKGVVQNLETLLRTVPKLTGLWLHGNLPVLFTPDTLESNKPVRLGALEHFTRENIALCSIERDTMESVLDPGSFSQVNYIASDTTRFSDVFDEPLQNNLLTFETRAAIPRSVLAQHAWTCVERMTRLDYASGSVRAETSR